MRNKGEIELLALQRAEKKLVYVELPNNGLGIKHPFHPPHLLIPASWYEGYKIRCKACWVFDSRYGLKCEQCGFTVHDDCASLLPIIKYQFHHHLLALFDSISQDFWRLCCLCRDFSTAFVLRCVACNFNLHLHCHPSLPRTINHECHPHPLTLTKSVVTEGDILGEDDYYCDACEESRDPNHPFYYCAECLFAAHVSCVISEVLASLLAKQESDAGATIVVVKPASTVGGFLRATAVDECHMHPLRCHPSLPLTIQHESHIHPLTLTGSVVNENDFSDEYYCNVCKENRNPEQLVYCCVECLFAAHISCVFSEVLPLLIAAQESDAGAKKDEINTASEVEGSPCASAADKAMARGDFVTVSSEKVGVVIAKDSILTKLDAEIEKLHIEAKELTAKLEAVSTKLETLEGERAQYVASSTMPSLGN